jgi:hypothetical protein
MRFTTVRLERPEGAVLQRGIPVQIEHADPQDRERLDEGGARPIDHHPGRPCRPPPPPRPPHRRDQHRRRDRPTRPLPRLRPRRNLRQRPPRSPLRARHRRLTQPPTPNADFRHEWQGMAKRRIRQKRQRGLQSADRRYASTSVPRPPHASPLLAGRGVGGEEPPHHSVNLRSLRVKTPALPLRTFAPFASLR